MNTDHGRMPSAPWHTIPATAETRAQLDTTELSGARRRLVNAVDPAVTLPTSADLAEQIRLLKAGRFYIDGWCRPRPETMTAIRALIDAGLLRTWESGSDEAQYTAVNFEITDLGRQALASVQP